ncbi:Ig-like domain-containing protein [Adhaeribacter sp. BT258]|uniref:Ig-like domain-containing protein n=1 Tax=Adhaeribacter terrigena TaxID=2793070 RepID=A0ABS1C340_9BACT|nr:Ig-like domain-containing domain [Adhaeribacter terrigena]MBK0403582.1 Ig-like domain-containing protein [Adhaeribacter terrigena]
MCAQNRLFAAFSLLFLSGCAAINAPEGGPRDEKKPSLTSISPANGTTNFKGKTITMAFDEDVRPNDLNKQLIISPNTENTYTVRNDRKTITVEFDKELEANTTYFLNFREAVEDITESNKAAPITLSFSTGAFLDTGSVTGTVMDYITSRPESDLTIAMYPESDTNNIRDHKPYYFTKSNSDGSFQLKNIKAGNYWIFAHGDKNANEYYDQQKEKIGYLLKPVAVNPRADSVVLKTVLLDTQKPFVLKTENFLDQNTIEFNEGIKTLLFRTVARPPKEMKLTYLQSPDGKKITVFPEKGSLTTQLVALSTDSAGNAGIDTVKFKLTGSRGIAERLNFKVEQNELQAEVENDIKIIFPIPVQITGIQPFTLIEDTTRKITPNFPKNYKLSQNNTELTLKYTPKALKQVELQIDTTQIVAINGKALQKQNISFTISRKATTGSISAIIKTNYQAYSVELLNEQGKVLDVKQNVRTVNYPQLVPGNYNIRVKIDEDKDGKWELGDKHLKTSPEKIYVYPKPISVRANWEIADLILTF